jgi:hypothetical protein
MALAAVAGLAAPAFAGTLTPLASFGNGGWRAPRVILAGDTPASNNGTNYNYLGDGLSGSSANLERSFAYNPATGHLILASRSPAGNGIRILDGATGVDLGGVAQAGLVTGGNFAFNCVAAGPDGSIYLSNLAVGVASTAFKVYKWTSEGAAAPTVFFNSTNPGGTVGNFRLGDSLAISKDGSTLAAGYQSNGSSVGVGYLTIDTSTAVATARTSFTPAVNNAFRLGITFGATSTDVLGKQTSDTLKITEYLTNTSATANLTSAGEAPIAHAVIAGVPYLAALDVNNSNVRVYDISNPTAPNLVATGNATSGTLVGNINATGSVQWGDIDHANQTATLYAMSSNQGIQAFTFVVPTPASGGLLVMAGLAAIRRRR